MRSVLVEEGAGSATSRRMWHAPHAFGFLREGVAYIVISSGECEWGVGVGVKRRDADNTKLFDRQKFFKFFEKCSKYFEEICFFAATM